MTPHRLLFVGLGNPGKEYEHTYHNAGFIALDVLRESFGADDEPRREKLFEYVLSPHAVFVKPRTYMNESGVATTRALAHFKLPTESLIVAHDDSDLPLGMIRISENRGAAGHHGVLSIIQALGTKNFSRIRIGIRQKTPAPRAMNAGFRHAEAPLSGARAGDFVLRPMTAYARRALRASLVAGLAGGGMIEKLILKSMPSGLNLTSAGGKSTD